MKNFVYLKPKPASNLFAYFDETMDKIKIFKRLDSLRHLYRAEEYRRLEPEINCLRPKLNDEIWKTSPPLDKQKKRLDFLNESTYKNDLTTHYLYYEKLIEVYSIIIGLLDKLDYEIGKVGVDSCDIGTLRICGVLLAEKDNMDKSMLPDSHVRVDVISNLANEFSLVYPELKLQELAKVYANMYRFWPGKPNDLYGHIIPSKGMITVYSAIEYKYSSNKALIDIPQDEVGLILVKSSSESWDMLDSYKKQDKRRWAWMRFKDDSDSRIKSPYYGKMICVYSCIIEILESLKKILKDDESIKNAEIGHLRICAILQIEKDHMDEDLIPKHHIQPHFISNLAQEYHDTYPDLNLLKLSKAYTEMYESWPDKPDYNLKPS